MDWMVWKTFFSVVLGGLVTIFTAIFVEHRRKPKLQITIRKPTDASYQGAPAQNARFLCVTVTNVALPWICRPIGIQINRCSSN
jgi:hypothetical protein